MWIELGGPFPSEGLPYLRHGTVTAWGDLAANISSSCCRLYRAVTAGIELTANLIP